MRQIIMFINFNTHSLILEYSAYQAQIKNLEKVSGYKIDVLIELFREKRVTILPLQDRNVEQQGKGCS